MQFDTSSTLKDTTVSPLHNTGPHSVTASLLTLPGHLLTSLQSSTETGREHTALLVSASPRSRHASGGGGTSGAASPRDVWKHAQPCQVDAKPCQAMSRTSWGATGRFATVYCAPSPTVSLLSSDTNHRPLRLISSCRV